MSNFLQISTQDDPYAAIFGLVALFSVFWYIWLFTNSKSSVRAPPFPPGPPGLPIIGNLPFLEPELHTYFFRLSRKYGPILKLRLGAKTAIVISSSAVAREILKTHDITFSNHDVPVAARVNTYGGVDILWLPYGAEWRMLRKVCVHKMLNSARLDSFYPLRRREIRRTIGYLAGRAGVRSPVNLGEHIFLTIFNVLTQMLWGATVEGEERESIAAEFRELVSEMVDIVGVPNISDFFPGLSRFDLQGLVKRMRGPAKRFDQIFDQIIDQRLAKDGESDEGAGGDLLQCLLKAKDEDPNTPLSLNHVKAVLIDILLGGSESSSNTIEFAMAELMSNPEIMERAQEELDKVIGKDSIVEESHVAKLPYMQAIMKETLRLHATFPLLIPRRPSQSAIVAGYTIPKDSKIFINVWAIHRDPEIWENPLEFNPDRFLDRKRDFTGSDLNYIPFGFGRRICAGIPVAERMILYVLAALLHSFDWKLPKGQTLEVEEKFVGSIKLKNSLVAIPLPRLNHPTLYI